MKINFLIISIGVLACLYSCNTEESPDITTNAKESKITTNQNNLGLSNITEEQNYSFLEIQNPEIDEDQTLDCFFGSEGTPVNHETQTALEVNYLSYLENSNLSGGEIIQGKPFTITRTGTNWYRWNCKSDKSTQGWSNSKAHARKKAKAACGSGNIIIEEVGMKIQVTASINQLIKL